MKSVPKYSASMKSSGKSLPTVGAMNDLKYARSIKEVAPMPAEVKDHNGKYFQVIDAGKPSIEKC